MNEEELPAAVPVPPRPPVAVTGSMDARFATLEDASRNLSLDVQALNETLKIVSRLEIEQREQRRKQVEMNKALSKNKELQDARLTRTRRTFAYGLLALAVILPLVSLLVYWALLKNVDQLLEQQRGSFLTSCHTRNQASKDQAAREQALADAETNPDLRAIHNRSAQQLRAGLPNCAVYEK